MRLQEAVKPDIGFNLKLYALEENGQSHVFQRRLAHSLQQNHLNRWGDRIEAAATANMFQPEIAYFAWNQGRVFYDSYRFWNNTSAHVDQMFTKEWLPWVLDVENPPISDSLDVLGKMSEDDNVISFYVVNFGKSAKSKEFRVSGFSPAKEATITQLGTHPLDARNSGEIPNLIVSKTENVNIGGSKFTHQFPGHSFTVIRMERK